MIPGYVRTSRRLRCPVCGSGDWCLVSEDRNFAICPRTWEGSMRTIGEAGYLHRVGDINAPLPGSQRPHATRHRPPPMTDLPGLYRQMLEMVTEPLLDSLATDLGVSASALTQLMLGYSAEHKAFSFPMFDGDAIMTGVRLRRRDGFKWSVKYSQSGLFMDIDTLDGRRERELYVVEGPTDTAAMLTMGLWTVGVPDCRSCQDKLLAFCLARGVRSVVLISDIDDVGINGAVMRANSLTSAEIGTRIVMPQSGKDARQWLQSGATESDVRFAAEMAEPWKTHKEAA